MTIEVVPFAVAVEDISAGSVKVPQSEFLGAGPLAVVDQGKSLIAGYTVDTAAAVRSAQPLIVFGDHTRAFKFVDFPFAMGADGVKVLRSREGFDPKFVYYYLRSRAIPNAGYSRHFKFLKEVSVPRPPLAEQRRISTILDHADDLCAKRRQVLVHLDALPQAVFSYVFGEPLAGGKTPLGRLLQDWIDPQRPITYGILKPGPDMADGVPYVRVADMQDRGIRVSGVRRTSQSIANEYRRSTLHAGDLLMSIRGHVGRCAVVPTSLEGANITQDSARLAIQDPLATAYVRSAIESPSVQDWMARRTKGAAVKGINLGDLRELPLIVPPADLLGRFARIVALIESQRESALTAFHRVQNLFESLQARAFDGRL